MKKKKDDEAQETPSVPMSYQKKTSLKRKPRFAKASVEALDKNRLVEVVLQFTHGINGKSYGPGRIRVKYKIAQMLKEQETRALEEVNNFRSTRTMIILTGNKGVQVSQGGLDAFLGQTNPYAILR